MTAETTSPQAGSPPAETRIDRLSPDALVASFSQSHLLKWFLAALAAHAIVIGGFSIGNIRDMIDPEAAAARKAAAIAAAKATSEPQAPAMHLLWKNSTTDFPSFKLRAMGHCSL